MTKKSDNSFFTAASTFTAAGIGFGRATAQENGSPLLSCIAWGLGGYLFAKVAEWFVSDVPKDNETS